jgi:hypothetical protein
VQKEEHLKSQSSIFKIGLTTKPYERFLKYKNCRIIIFIEVCDCFEFEEKLLKKFKSQFTHEKKFGREYFSGDPERMKEIILDMVIGSLIPQKKNILNIEQPVLAKRNLPNQCIYIKTRGPDKGKKCSLPCEFNYCSKCLNLKTVKALLHDKDSTITTEDTMQIDDSYIL